MMITQIRLEAQKLIRARSFYLSFIALATFVALMLWGFYTYAERKGGEGATAQFKYTYESKSYFNGLTFALYSIMFSFSLLIPVFVAMTAGAQIAGERQSGTLRMICVRPVSRVSLLLSKFVVTAGYTYLLVSFFILLNLLVGLLFVGWGDLQLYPGALNLVDEPGTLLRLNGDHALHLKIDEAEIPRVNELLVSQGFRVKELSPQRESLEGVFLRLTRATKDDR